MTVEHADWSTRPVRAGVGLTQGCPGDPMIFRWALADCMASLHDGLVCEGPGAQVDTDTWDFDNHTARTRGHASRLRTRGQTQHGTGHSVGKYGYAQASGPPQPPPPADATCEHRTAREQHLLQSPGELCTVEQGLRPRVRLRPETVLRSLPRQEDIGWPQCRAHRSSACSTSGAKLVRLRSLLGDTSARFGPHSAVADGATGVCAVASCQRGHCNILPPDGAMVRQGPRSGAHTEMGRRSFGFALEIGGSRRPLVGEGPGPPHITCPLLERCVIPRNSSSNAMAALRPDPPSLGHHQ